MENQDDGADGGGGGAGGGGDDVADLEEFMIRANGGICI